MPRVIVLSFKDLGSSYRLLRHIKSFASQQDSFIYAIGPCESVLPKEIEDLPNIKIHNLFCFGEQNSSLSVITLPFKIIFVLFQILILISKIPNADFVLIQSSPLILSYLCGYLIKIIKKCKLIVDIRPFQGVVSKQKSSISKYEYSLPKLADIRIVPSRSMQGSLQLKKLQSFIIKDNPGTLFKPSLELRGSIFSLLNVEPDTGLIGIPFPIMDANAVSSLIGIIKRCDEFNKKLAFIIFGGGKSQKALEEKLKGVELKSTKFFVMPMLTDVYPQIMGACDLGVSLFGATKILDLSQEIVEMEWCCVPIATKLYGCVREAVTDETGFFFKTDDELVEIIKKVFVDKSVDIDSMREACKKQLIDWDKSWNEAFSPFFECNKE